MSESDCSGDGWRSRSTNILDETFHSLCRRAHFWNGDVVKGGKDIGRGKRDKNSGDTHQNEKPGMVGYRRVEGEIHKDNAHNDADSRYQDTSFACVFK